MKQRFVLLHLLSALTASHAFLPAATAPPACRQSTMSTTTTTTTIRHMSSDNASRFEGNRRIPTAEEISIMDEMIDKLANAAPYELPGAVKRAFRIIRSPPFFLRIAERADQAASEEEKEKLGALATNLASTLEVVVETTEEQLDERAGNVEAVVKAAAEPDSGEFLVPLTPERLEAMQSTIKAVEESSLDEGFLATLDSWIVKSHQDGMDLMVGILQKVLQMYAGLQIQRSLARTPEFQQDDTTLLLQLLESDADSWANQIGTIDAEDDLPALKKQVQKTMETIVLSLETGSMAQQVQAEYLKELMKRVEDAETATA